ncbi:hypothetical protein XELAEV_18034381mg [Xenopus laevis]|uniref:G-protein coupled receptors family 1 profile domain-containing protein n=1 Tax=Xenopus laevis TaxID=8355 RepID=A0A974HBG7_XENLA|nr:hypothetical protein XELAEV_18034381mg [Xenopus laevis]
MLLEKQGNVSEFIIRGFGDISDLQLPIFMFFLCIYLVIVLGNLIVLLAISFNSILHTPMYILLLNLSIVDISFTTNILPNLLHMIFTQQNTISFWGCMYVAICDPLHYIDRMSLTQRALLITATWMVGFLTPVSHFVFVSKLSFCSSNVINHFYCDATPLLQLSCSVTFHVELSTYIEGILLTFNSLLFILTSYIYIISAILKVPSSEGRQKAFSTCASHLTSVIMLYVSIFCLYMRPKTIYSLDRDKFFALFYTILIPMLNPIIYTLKNRDFQTVFNKLRQKVNNCIAFQ